MTLSLTVLSDPLAVCRLAPEDDPPPWARGQLVSVTRTAGELSVVCAHDAVPDGVRADGPWRALSVSGPLPFTATGVLAALAGPLAAAGIPIFALSTFDTDHLLVGAGALDDAIAVLREAGHRVTDS